jgi:hypothetical protein
MIDPLPGYMDRLASVNDALVSLLEFLNPGGIRYSTADQPSAAMQETGMQELRERA